MLRRPSYRAKKGHEEVHLNLVPLMDALVTLIIFLMATTTLLNIVEIDSALPIASNQEPPKSSKPPIQLTVKIKNNSEFLVEADFGRKFAPKRIRPLDSSEFQGQADVENSLFDFPGLHDVLVQVKTLYPFEQTVVLNPEAGVPYDVLVQVMDVSRNLSDSDPPIFQKDENGVEKAVTKLFPNVVFGNTFGG